MAPDAVQSLSVDFIYFWFPSIEGGTTVIISYFVKCTSYAILGQDLIPSFPDLLLSHSSQKPLISSAPWLLLSWCQFSLSQDRSSCYMCVTFSVFIYQLILQTGCLFISDDSITWVDRHSVRLYSHRLIWLFWKGLLFQFHGWMDCFARDDFLFSHCVMQQADLIDQSFSFGRISHPISILTHPRLARMENYCSSCVQCIDHMRVVELNWYIYIYKYWPYIFWSYVNIYIYLYKRFQLQFTVNHLKLICLNIIKSFFWMIHE